MFPSPPAHPPLSRRARQRMHRCSEGHVCYDSGVQSGWSAGSVYKEN